MKKKKKSKRPKKIADLIAKVKSAVLIGNYYDMNHTKIRKAERDITRPEYEYVLLNGWHEKSKDEYQEEFQAWNYSIRGKTIDGRQLRVIVSFDSNNMLIITVIDLEVSEL